MSVTVRNRFQPRDDRGFTLVTVMLTMMVLAMLAVGAYAASVGDMPVARKDQDRKRAYEAAQAGVDWYLNLLRADPDYWQKCVPSVPTVSEPLTAEGASTVAWQPVDGGGAPARFRVELMKQGGVACDPADPTTAQDPAGRIWIRASGASAGKVRSILVGLEQHSDFLNYAMFTNWESQDPQLANASRNWDPNPAPSGTIGGNVSQCDYNKKTRDKGPLNQYSQLVCLSMQYVTGDQINGPYHTNDDGIMACGATFGRAGEGDTLEVSGGTTGSPGTWNARGDVINYGDRPFGPLTLGYTCPGGSGNPTPNATVVAPAPVMQLPPSNVKVLDAAAPENTFYGQTCIALGSPTAGMMTVWDAPGGISKATLPATHTQWGTGAGTQADPKTVTCGDGAHAGRQMAIPSGGVIAIRNHDSIPCTPRYGHNAATSYSSSPSCGDVAISGTIDRALTVAADNDIIVTANITRTGNGMLGLVANGFVRLFNPYVGDPYRYENQETELQSPTVTWWDPGCWWSGGWCTGPNPDYMPCPGSAWGNSFPGRIKQLPGFTPVTRIDAAIMSMRHTLQLDNMLCPPYFSAPNNKLTINGAVSTYWGVQTGGCVILGCSGYENKIWNWDSRLKTAQPPKFITPLNSDGRWTVSRRTEQVPTPVTPPPA